MTEAENANAYRRAWTGGLRQGRAREAAGAQGERGRGLLRARQGGPRRGSAQGVCAGEGPARASAEELEDAGSARADEVVQCRPLHDGLRDAVRAAAGARCAHGSAPSSTTPRCCRCTAARHRSTGRSPWARRETGLSIFWPDEGLDEGPILLQKKVEIGPDETLGDVYFKKLFPMGVDAMMERLDLVRAGKAPKAHAGPLQDDLRELVQEGRRRDRLGQACRRRLQPDPRRQSGARRLEHDQGPEGRHLRQRKGRGQRRARRGARDRRPGYDDRRRRRRHPRQARPRRRRQEDRRPASGPKAAGVKAGDSFDKPLAPNIQQLKSSKHLARFAQEGRPWP